MSEHQPSPGRESDPSEPGSVPVVPMTDSQLRRRLLLKGLGRGSAVIAAAAPIKTLAVTQSVTQNGLMCTVSGVGSAAHSTGGTVKTCGGLSPGYYKTPSHWPGYSSAGNTSKATNTIGSVTFYEDFKIASSGLSQGGPVNNTSTQDTAFNAIFGGGLSAGVFYILKNKANTDEFHWIAALLNAILYATTGQWPKSPSVFPYSPSEVLALYKNDYASALSFFKGYMETL